MLLKTDFEWMVALREMAQPKLCPIVEGDEAGANDMRNRVVEKNFMFDDLAPDLFALVTNPQLRYCKCGNSLTIADVDKCNQCSRGYEPPFLRVA